MLNPTQLSIVDIILTFAVIGLVVTWQRERKRRINQPFEKAQALHDAQVREGVLEAKCGGLEQEKEHLEDQANQIAPRLVKAQAENTQLQRDNELYILHIVDLKEALEDKENEILRWQQQTAPMEPVEVKPARKRTAKKAAQE